ncbi:hypothetical protein E2320_016027 [Naja naja]|nr:hypothetical protein E2320_016027 [Naja naja]
MDSRVGHQVGLEFCEIYIQGTIKSQGSCDGGHNLTDKAVEVGVGGALDVKVSSANVIDGFVVYHEGTVGVLQGGVGGQDGVVGLNDSCGYLGSWVDGELQLGLLAIVNGQALHQQGGKARASTATKTVEDQKTLETCALVGLLERKKKDFMQSVSENIGRDMKYIIKLAN